MEKIAANEKENTLSEEFDFLLSFYYKLDESSLPSSSEQFQDQLNSCIERLQRCSVYVSDLSLFSSNETFDEINTVYIKFLLLPALLGHLTLKLLSSPRLEVLDTSKLYFLDFLKSCKEYEVMEFDHRTSDFDNDSEDNLDYSSAGSTNTSSTDRILALSKVREEKINKFKTIQELKRNSLILKNKIKSGDCEDDIVRNYYINLVKQFIYSSFDELEHMKSERSLLAQMSKVKANAKDEMPKVVKNTLKPVLITRNELEKKVFGAGYPSLPVMTVDEFYEDRVKSGKFPCASSNISKYPHVRDSHNDKSLEEEENDDDDDDKNIKELRESDDWRDTHRTGWGNTYNRS